MSEDLNVMLEEYYDGDFTNFTLKKTIWENRYKYKREWCYKDKTYIITGDKVYHEMKDDKDGCWKPMHITDENVVITLKGESV